MPTVVVGGLCAWTAPLPEATVIVPENDDREGIVVSLEEREITLLVMRENLDNLHASFTAMARNDRLELARQARHAAELHGPARRSPSLREKLPEGWRALGKQVDLGFERLAVAAESPDADLMGHLTKATSACVACHARYRLDLSL